MVLIVLALVVVGFGALLVGLVVLAVSLARTTVKGGAGASTPRGFAAVAAGEGWGHTDRDENLPRVLSPLLPAVYDNTAALDVLSGHVQGRDAMMFRYPAVDVSGGSLSVWAVRLPQNLPPLASDGADPGYAQSLASLVTIMDAQGFTGWRIQNGFLQAWSAGQEHKTRQLLTRLEPLVRAIEGIPPNVWQERGLQHP